MDTREAIKLLLEAIGPRKSLISETAYDTSWIARLHSLDPELGEQALDWLREHQLTDGSWGAEQPYYHHDRLISTLGALAALAERGQASDLPRIERGITTFQREIQALQTDRCGETIGFEMIVPPLIEEARSLEALLPIYTGSQELLARIAHKRAAKLAALPSRTINRGVSAAFSAEMAGLDERHLLDLDNLQEYNGSVAHSPSATAYFALYARPGDPAALQYLHQILDSTSDGGAPVIVPTDVFEIGWTLYNLTHAGPLDPELEALCRPGLDFLKQIWVPGRGVAYTSSESTPRDSDDTGLIYALLSRFDIPLDIEAVLHYEDKDHFRCMALEANPSISANIHVLDALHMAHFPGTHPAVQKIFRFLDRVRGSDPYWFDKWHTSPYYPTSHAIIAGAEYEHPLIEAAVRWLIDSQREDGAWGYYMPTAEETAYALHALYIWKRQGRPIPDGTLDRGLAWLLAHREPPYPPLWIGKALYTPIRIIQSAILGTLRLAQAIDG